MRRVSADSDTLLYQAMTTTARYLKSAIMEIDDELGKGYAKQHPELIAAYMRTAAVDFQAGVIAGALEDISESIEKAAEALESLDVGES
jgi:uncharacterized protein YukE